MKFDLNRAWADAVGMIGGNSRLIAVVAGLFFFVPYLALGIASPALFGDLEAKAETMTGEQLFWDMLSVYAQYWWVMVLMAVINAMGMLALIVLLADRTRPTVGEALAVAGRLLLPYLAASLLLSIGLALVSGLMMGLGAATGQPAIAIVAYIVGVLLAIYLYMRLSLMPAAMPLDRLANPIAALRASWVATKGNAFRLFLFLFLLMMALTVVSIVLGMVFGLVFSLFGEDIALFGNAFVSAAINTAFLVVFLAVLAASYRQLSGPAEPASVPRAGHQE